MQLSPSHRRGSGDSNHCMMQRWGAGMMPSMDSIASTGSQSTVPRSSVAVAGIVDPDPGVCSDEGRTNRLAFEPSRRWCWSGLVLTGVVAALMVFVAQLTPPTAREQTAQDPLLIVTSLGPVRGTRTA
eukprot:SAG31_NODE_26486_length_441_cov_1.055556_1_plen_127_part_01